MARISDCPSCGAPLKFGGTQDFVVCEFCGIKVPVPQEETQTSEANAEKPASQAEEFAELFFVDSSPKSEPKPEPEPDGIQFKFGDPVSEQPVESSAPSLPDIVPPPYTPVGTPSAQPASSIDWKRWVIIGAIALLVLCALCVCGVAAIIVAVNGGSLQ